MRLSVFKAEEQGDQLEEKYFAETIRLKRLKELARTAILPIAFLYGEEGQFDNE